jgi:protein required for attachment to host cells
MKPIITWIVAADGSHCRIFEHRGPGKGLAPVTTLDYERARLRAQDIEADRPGRSFSSVGQGRSAIEPHTDPVEHEEENFARKIAALLESKWGEHAFTRLVIAADPTTLGNIRSLLSPALDGTILAELHKDLTNVPLPDMGKHFEDILPV